MPEEKRKCAHDGCDWWISTVLAEEQVAILAAHHEATVHGPTLSVVVADNHRRAVVRMTFSAESHAELTRKVRDYVAELDERESR